MCIGYDSTQTCQHEITRQRPAIACSIKSIQRECIELVPFDVGEARLLCSQIVGTSSAYITSSCLSVIERISHGLRSCEIHMESFDVFAEYERTDNRSRLIEDKRSCIDNHSRISCFIGERDGSSKIPFRI